MGKSTVVAMRNSLLLALTVGSCLIDSTVGFGPTARITRFDHSLRRFNRFLLRNEPLASEGDWTAHLDSEGTGLIYFFNARTGQSMWEPPTDTFPQVTLDPDLKQIAKIKQEEYIKSVKTVQEETGSKGFLSSLLDSAEATDKDAVAEKAGNEWFKSIFEERVGEQQQELEQVEASLIDSAPAAAPEKDQKLVSAEEVVVESPKTSEKEKAPSLLGRIFESAAAPAADLVQEPEPASKAVDDSEGTAEKSPSLLDLIFAKPEPKPVVQSEEEEESKPIKLDVSAYVLPHPAKVRWGGEDAVFVKGRTFGVFDGVSGADKLDGVPLFSKTLAKELTETVGQEALNAGALVKQLTAAATIANQIATGASTALIASIGEDGFLRALNVGDSTGIVVRDGKVVGKTREISHYFECPYQLSEDSPDRPRDGTRLNMELMRGDMIIMGSDGIFDNLGEEKILEIATAGSKPPSIIAKRLSDQSRKVSLKKDAETPYAKLAKKYGDPAYASGLGGKVDDVSCIVARYG